MRIHMLVALATVCAIVSANAVLGRSLQQAAPPTAEYRSLSQALAAQPRNLTIFLAAVKAANVTGALDNDTAWTIFAPTDEAFRSQLNGTADDGEDLGLTQEQLLEAENRETLIKVLSYHVIPEAALRAADLEDGQNLTTAVEGAKPLELHIEDFDSDGTDNVEVVGAHNAAEVVVPDIVAGKSVIHVIDHVLIPEGMGTGEADHDHDEAPAASPAPAAARSGAAGVIKAPVALLAGMLLVGLLF